MSYPSEGSLVLSPWRFFLGDNLFVTDDQVFYQVIEEPDEFYDVFPYTLTGAAGTAGATGTLTPLDGTVSGTPNLQTDNILTIRQVFIGVDNVYAQVQVQTRGVQRLRTQVKVTNLTFLNSPLNFPHPDPFYTRQTTVISLSVINQNVFAGISGNLDIRGYTLKLRPLKPASRVGAKLVQYNYGTSSVTEIFRSLAITPTVQAVLPSPS